MIAVVRMGRRKMMPWEVWLDDRLAVQDLPDDLRDCTNGGRTFGRFATECAAKLFSLTLEQRYVEYLQDRETTNAFKEQRQGRSGSGQRALARER